MKIPCTVATLLVAAQLSLPLLSTATNVSIDNAEANFATHSDEVFKMRLSQLDLPVPVKLTSDVKYKIRDYVVYGTKSTAGIIGRSEMFMPVFEHYLMQEGLPVSLKYLPVLESNVRPEVKSASGAAGLWQMMPGTANKYGLVINGSVDERLDAYKSSKAAAKMLKELYKEFKNWELVLAAYNCGPGRVSMAIRSAGGKKDYATVSKYLPEQTQKYVPAFIAAAYVVNYYDQHNIRPAYALSVKPYDLRAVKVYSLHSLTQIANQCKLSYSTIKALNSGYIGGIIPRTQQGNYLILPSEAMEQFKIKYNIGNQDSNQSSGFVLKVSSKVRTSYMVQPGDKLETVAASFLCSAQDIMKWNGITNPELYVRQELILFIPPSFLQNRA